MPDVKENTGARGDDRAAGLATYRARASSYDLAANLYYLIGFREWAFRRRAVAALGLKIRVAPGGGRTLGPNRRRSWEKIERAMRESLRDVAVEELYGGFAFLAVGRTI